MVFLFLFEENPVSSHLKNKQNFKGTTVMVKVI